MLVVQEKLPTCTEAGYKACYQCQSCKKLYLDKAGTEETTVEEITLPPTGHQYKDGICTVCGEIDPDYVKPHEHSMTAVQEKKPTCTEAGNKAYYRCETCGKLYLDKDGKNETTLEKVTIAVTGHIYRDGRCVVCKALVPAVKTGDFDKRLCKMGDWTADLTQHYCRSDHLSKIKKNRITGLYHPLPEREPEPQKRASGSLFLFQF